MSELSVEESKVADILRMPSVNQEINNIMGYGQVIEVLVGLGEDEKPITKKYHMTPVALEDIPELITTVEVFMSGFNKEGSTPFSKESTDKIAEAIVMSLKRMHPNIKKEEVLKNFSLGLLAKCVEIILDLNDFLSQMAAVGLKMQNIQSK